MTRKFSILWVLSMVSGSLSAEELHLLQSIELPGVQNRIDHMDVDPSTMKLFVGALENDSLEVIDLRTGQVMSRTEVGGHPEGVQVQASTGLALANVPTRGKIVAIDLVKARIKAEWKPEGLFSNFPLAVEEGVSRGAYYTHVPSQVVLFDTLTGKSLSQTPAPSDIDDLFFDEGSQRLYLISGSGQVEVWSVASGRPRVLGSVATGPGARTGLLVPALKRLFVAVPQRKGLPARILVFEVD